MTLTHLIDLIAEVAAKRATQEGRSKEETPNAVAMTIRKILSKKRHLRFVSLKIGFVFLDAVRQLCSPRRP